jgi:5-methylcytosine-specific restriction endonuclease McrA
VIPIAEGGSDTADNLRVCCRRCNSLKGTASE